MSLTGEERVVIYGGGGRGRGGGMEGLWMCHDKVYLISLKGYVIFLFPPPPSPPFISVSLAVSSSSFILCWR